MRTVKAQSVPSATVPADNLVQLLEGRLHDRVPEERRLRAGRASGAPREVDAGEEGQADCTSSRQSEGHLDSTG